MSGRRFTRTKMRLRFISPQPFRQRASIAAAVFSFAMIATALPAKAGAPALKISENKHYFVTETGEPFFWLGDTAWELFHRLSREEAEEYLAARAQQRFTVIQAVALSEFDGIRTPNFYGELPLVGEDPEKPNEAYFQHVDWVVRKANELGLVIAMLPTWADKVGKTNGAGPQVFTPENAFIYGKFLGARYKDARVVWVLGGDRRVDDDVKRAVWRSLARGLREGDGGTHLVTFHPNGGSGSADYFGNDDPLLDFNMRQDGHGDHPPTNARINTDYHREPPKPVIDGEPLYEDHPIAFNAEENGYSNAADIRRFLYWDLFGGACGHTYGNHSIWQFYDPREGKGVNRPICTWREALHHPGGEQVQHARELIESRPVLSRIPDNTLITPEAVSVGTPGAGSKLIVGTRDASGSYAMIYVPSSRTFTVNLESLSGEKFQAWWFNPRTGGATPIGVFEKARTKQFTPPAVGETLDWVLVIDDVSKNYAKPGNPNVSFKDDFWTK